MGGRDDRPLLEPEPAERGRQLVQARGQLQVDVETDVRGLVHEERERLLEGRKLGRDLAQLGERALAHGAVGGATAHLVEPIRVREHERPARQVEHVELDEVDALRDCCAKRA